MLVACSGTAEKEAGKAEWGSEDKLEMWIKATLGVVLTPRPKGMDSNHLTVGNYGEIYIKEREKIKVIFFFTRFFILWVLRYLHLPDREGSPTGFLLLPQVSKEDWVISRLALRAFVMQSSETGEAWKSLRVQSWGLGEFGSKRAQEKLQEGTRGGG